jgi:hypothetical protein
LGGDPAVSAQNAGSSCDAYVCGGCNLPEPYLAFFGLYVIHFVKEPNLGTQYCVCVMNNQECCSLETLKQSFTSKEAYGQCSVRERANTRQFSNSSGR